MVDSPLPPPAPETTFSSINKEVKAAVASGQATVKDAVVKALAAAEIAKRTTLFTNGFTKLSDATRELAQLERAHDVVTFTPEGVESRSFSKAAFEKVKKAKELVTKLHAALDAAATKADYEALKKLTGKEPEAAPAAEN